MDSNSNQAKQAIISAASAGHINQVSSQALLANLNANTVPSTIGSQVQLLETTTPLVLNIIVDSSGSMGGYENEVIDAINGIVGDFKLMRNKTGQEMYLSVKEFSSRGGQVMRTIQDFIHVQDYVELTRNDYSAGGATPLCDATYDGITQTMAFGSATFAFGATGVQEITIIITDGNENDSRTRDEKAVAKLLSELNTKPNFVAALVGIGNDPYDLIAKSMGFLDGNIFAADKAKNGITKALKLISSSVSQRSMKSQSGQPVTSNDFFVTP